MNSLVNANANAVSTAMSNVFIEHGREYAGMSLGRLMKFAKGAYESQNSVIPLGKQFIAAVREIAVGYVKFAEDGSKVEQRIGKLIDNFKKPDRSTLGDLDESRWPKGRDGRPKDVWLSQTYLPLIGVDDESFAVTFVTNSHGGNQAIGKLSEAYGRRLRDMGVDALPVIELGVEQYKHKMYGLTSKPNFSIVRWTDEAPAVGYDFDVVHDEPPHVDDDLPF